MESARAPVAKAARVTSGAAAVGFSARPIVRALRPHQWVKNAFVFAGIIFANELDDPGAWGSAIACFVAFCAASSAAYLVNDIRDAEEDRAHPLKRTRPIATGELSATMAGATAAGLLALATGLALFLGLDVLLFLLLFVALQGAYTAVLKNIAILDVFAIALLFVIRAAVGAAAVGVEISTWLLLCTGLLSLLLALAKRRAELVLVDEGQAAGRRSLYGYSVSYVDQCLTLVGAATVIAYSLYSIEAAVPGMAVTIPFVAYGVLRYLMLVHLRGWGEEPDRILIKDRPLQLAIVVWILVAAAVLVEAG